MSNPEGRRTPLHTGGCQCGAVRFAVYAEPIKIGICHCRMCQKAVAGPFAVLAEVPWTEFARTRGTPSSFRSSSRAVRDFCAACGTPLSFRYLDSDWIDVTIGSLDRPREVPPGKQYGAESRLPWFEELISLPSITTAESMEQSRQTRLVDHQHPDHDTSPDWRPRSGT